MLDPLTRVDSEFIYYGEGDCDLTPDWHPGFACASSRILFIIIRHRRVAPVFFSLSLSSFLLLFFHASQDS